MTLRFYFDEDCMRQSLITALRARNVDVVTVYEASMIEREDSEQLEYASQRGRVVYSSNIGDFYLYRKSDARYSETNGCEIRRRHAKSAGVSWPLDLGTRLPTSSPSFSSVLFGATP